MSVRPNTSPSNRNRARQGSAEDTLTMRFAWREHRGYGLGDADIDGDAAFNRARAIPSIDALG